MALAHKVGQPAPRHSMTEAEYLTAEQLADERHEYVDGQVFLMAGTSKRHNRIAGNFYRMFMSSNNKACEAFMSDVKVRARKHKSFYYPDVVVGCADDDDSDDYYLEKPCLIVEVLSPSTLRKDYLEKTVAYQALPSLQAYLIVAQEQMQIDLLLRTETGWVLQQFDQPEQEIPLPCVDMQMSVASVYEGVTFKAAAPPDVENADDADSPVV